MKKLLTFAAMMLITLSTHAQLDEGTLSVMPKVGANLSDISGAGKILDNKWGIAAGAEVEYKFEDWFGVSAGLMYEQQGVEVSNTNYKLKTEYVIVPIMAKFYVWQGLALSTGIQPGFLTKAKFGNSDDNFDIKNDIRKFDFAIPIAISYEFPFGLNLELKYYDGVVDVVKDNFNTTWTGRWSRRWYEDKNKNRTLQLSIGYKFSVGVLK